MLWRIRDSEMFLLGSIHVMDAKPLDLSIAERIVSQSQRVAFEYDFAEQPDVSDFLIDDLRAELPLSLFTTVRKRWVDAGLPEASLSKLPPWLAAMTLMMILASARGITKPLGVDNRLWSYAVANGKQIVPLET